jgi:serine/threonine protein kinase
VQGALLGNYRVVEKLGAGGMGVVYIGRHEALGHHVVVKVLRPEMSRHAGIVQRFFNEAQAATAIRNPGIVQVFDFGTTPDGHAYFVMELLEGQTLDARIKQRRPTSEDCCRLGRQIANVLQAAHAAGITHRDLKPDNLFLVPDAEVVGGERVKVLDFGIAKLAGEVGVKTGTGLIMGTPNYMSPEQCRSANTADPRSDIYSLGCILFLMACGRPPFARKGIGDIVAGHLHDPPPPPQSLAPDIPAGLAALILTTLAKQPSERPQTMTAVSQTLDEILRTLGGAPARAPTPLPVPQPAPPSAHSPAPPPAYSPVPPSPLHPAPPPAAPPAPPPQYTPTSLPAHAPTISPRSPPTPPEYPPTSLPVRPATPSPRYAPAPAPSAMPPPAHFQTPPPTYNPAPRPALPPMSISAHASTSLPAHASTPFPAPSSTPPPAYSPASLPAATRTSLHAPPAPLSVSQDSPTSITLQNATGSATPQSRTTRPLPFMLGGLVIVGAGAAIATVLANSHPVPPERKISYQEIRPGPHAADAATTTLIEDAAVIQPRPPPTAPIVSDAAAETSSPFTASDLETKCREHAANRKWNQLAQCAEQLAPLDPKRSAELRTQALEEARSEPHTAAVKAALHDSSLKRAKTELDQIWTRSLEYAPLKRSYDIAEAQVIDTLAIQLDSLKDSSCRAYNQLLDKERPINPPHVLAEATRRIPCTPPKRCDTDALTEMGRKQFVVGHLPESLAAYEAAYACSPTPPLILKTFVVACNLRNLAKARSYWKQLSSEKRTQALVTCVRNDITEAMLNTP